MLKTMVRGKIHRATVTETDVDYEGSVTVDRDLLDAADILEYAADLADVFFGQVLHAHVRTHACRAKNVVRPFPPDTVDIGEAHLDPLRARKVDACDSCHLLSLPLLVLRIRADDPDHPTAADDLALVAHFLH